MPKAKTKKAISKRFKITKNGKVLRRTAGQNHLRSKKSGNKIRKIRKWLEVSPTEAKRIKKVIKR